MCRIFTFKISSEGSVCHRNSSNNMNLWIVSWRQMQEPQLSWEDQHDIDVHLCSFVFSRKHMDHMG